MKKRILFFALMVALLVCAFAISASASTIYRDENGTELFNCELDGYHIKSYEIKNGGFAKVDSEGNALTWYLDSTTTEGDNTIKLVKSVKTNEVFANGNYTNGIDKLKVVSASWDKGTTSIPAFGAYSGSYSKEILFIYVPDEVTALPDRLVQNASAVVCEITPNSKLTSIGALGLYGAKSLREFYIPSGVSGEIGGQYAEGASRLTKVEFGENCSITALKSRAFYGCSSLQSITLPNTVTTVESRVFQLCTNLAYINLGANLTYMNKTEGDHSFAFQASALRTVIISKTFKAENIGENLNYAFQNGWNTSNAVVFYYTGTEAEFKLLQEKLAKAGNNGEICGATVENGRLVLVNHCETFYNGVHAYEENDCVRTCKNCGIVTKQENQKHNLSVAITYENGYLKVGNKYVKCGNTGCAYEDNLEVKPLIYFAGISTNDDDTAICVRYAVNKDAIQEYRGLGNTFKYGVVACAPQENSLEVLNSDLTNASDYNTVAIEMDEKYSAFDFVMKGFTEALYETSFVMCAFVSDGTSVDYINTSIVSGEGISVSQEAEATTISLKSIVEYTPSTEEK